MIQPLRTCCYVALLFLVGCGLIRPSQQPAGETVVGRIGSETVTFEELLSRFGGPEISVADSAFRQEINDFLPLYMDYRLKLTIAMEAGYLKDPDILSELEEYKRQSAYPFWIERQVREAMLDELVERSSELIHAQHILIEIPDNASPSDTLEAYQQLMRAREVFLSGQSDFLSLAQEYSSRRRGQSMGGDLGFFSAGWAVKSFEDGAYATPAGEVSLPVRSPFGYHLIYVVNRIEKGPEKKFSHIYFMTRNTDSPIDSIMMKANEAYYELQNNRPWNHVVEQYSQDEQTRTAGGNIGWIEYGAYEQAFVDSIMTLTQPGEISRPFPSPYGIHIVRLDSLRQPAPGEIREQLAENLRQLPRYRDNRRAVLDKAARIGDASFHRESLSVFEDFLREPAQNESESSNWTKLDNLPAELAQKPVFFFNNQSYSVQDYAEWLSRESLATPDTPYHHRMADDFKDHVIDSNLISLTESTFPDFAELGREYLQGLAVFQVNEDSLWVYAQQDTLRLRELFDSNPETYFFNIRYRFIRFSASSDSLLNQSRKKLLAGEAIDSIRAQLPNVIIQRDMISRIDQNPYTYLSNLEEGTFSPHFDDDRRRSVLLLEEILPSRPMTFEEARNRLISDYQVIREKEWLQAMRSRYQLELYPDKLEQALSKKHE